MLAGEKENASKRPVAGRAWMLLKLWTRMLVAEGLGWQDWDTEGLGLGTCWDPMGLRLAGCAISRHKINSDPLTKPVFPKKSENK